MAETVKQECCVRTQERPCWRVRVARAAALTLRRTRSNEGCSQLSVRPTELELRRSHSVQQVHLRLPLPRSAQIHLPRTARQPAHYDMCIRVSLYTTSCQPSATAANRGPACMQARPPFCAATKYPPTGSTLSELASVSGVGGCALKPLGTKRLPGAEGPSETLQSKSGGAL